MRARRLALLATASAVLAGTAVPSLAARPAQACTGRPSSLQTLSYASGGGTAKAVYALPAKRPRGIVVFDHGYSHTMYSWAEHVKRTAATLGVIAIAPDYRGQVDTGTYVPGKSLPSSRGWQVAEGAQDTIAVARLFESACHPSGPNVVYGVSMGGNTSGLVVAAKPKDATGRPLFDYWVDIEGAVNVTETYVGAKVLAPANSFAKNASEDIEREMGGTPQTRAQVYADETVVNRVDDIAASGVKGVVMVHGIVDGLVTHDESRQLQARLRAAGIPVDLTAVLTKEPGTESGTTLDGYVPVPHDSPFAGHASETSTTHTVGKLGFEALASIYRTGGTSCHERLIDGATGLSVGSSLPC